MLTVIGLRTQPMTGLTYMRAVREVVSRVTRPVKSGYLKAHRTWQPRMPGLIAMLVISPPGLMCLPQLEVGLEAQLGAITKSHKPPSTMSHEPRNRGHGVLGRG